MKLLLVLCAVVAAAAADPATECFACLRGKCLGPATFFGNRKEPSASRASIYQKDNIMYYRDSGIIKAINLDNNVAEPVPMLVNNILDMTVDGVTGDLYYYNNNEYKVYKYQPKTNETSMIVSVPSKKLQPYKAWAYDGTLYFNQKDLYNTENGLNFVQGSTVHRVPALENIVINDIAFDSFGNMYITSDRKLYVYKTNKGNNELELIDAKIHDDTVVLSDKNGVIYVFDTRTNKHLIYELNPVTEKLNQVGAYLDPKYVNLVMLDKNNNVIFRSHNSMSYYKCSTDECVINTDDNGGLKIIKLL